MTRKILMTSVLSIITVLLTAYTTVKDEFCTIQNRSFQEGEIINYNIYYNVIGLYVNAGSAQFTVNSTKFNNKPAYHIVGSGSSNTKYDWIFKVRDTYQTFIDTGSLRPYKFLRNVNEGGYKINENIVFDQKSSTAVSEKGTFKVPTCVQDVLSSIYYARNIEFDRYQPNDRIPFNMFLDNEVHNLYIKYLGKETIKTRYGKFKALKFKPLLVKGTLFEGGEKMTVWVSDDANHVPLRIESPIIVGNVKVDMMQYRNLRYPMTSFVGF